MAASLLRAALLLSCLAAVPAWSEPFPADSGVLDVRSFGAKGDGKTDDTAAIQAAIKASGEDTGRSFWQDRIVYVPDGVYRVSATLLKRYANGTYASGLLLIGQSREHTILKLADHALGFDNPERPKAIVFTSSKQIGGTPTSGGKDYIGLGEGNDAYMNFVEDLTIEAGEDNPGAIGIDYLANNIGAIRNVRLHAPAGSGVVGLAMTRKWPGPALVQRLTVEGFGTGIDIAQTEYGLTLEHVRLSGQAGVGLRNSHNSLAIRGLDIESHGPALVNATPGGLIAVDGGSLNGGPVKNAGTLVFRGVRSAGREISGIQTGNADWSPQGRPAWAMEPSETPAPFREPVARWANAAKFGAVGDGATDDTAALRRAFASGAAVVYLPSGTYAISGRIDIPASVRRIAGMNSALRVLQPRARGFAPTGGMFRVATGGELLTIERLAFDNTDLGLQVAIEIAGSRDVEIRDVVSAGTTLVDRKPEGGRLFLENICCGKLQFAGPRPVYARQLDTEGGGTRIRNQGAPLWILGLKTEGVMTVVDNQAGARTDVFGGLLYMVRPSDPAVPAFRNEGSWLAATFAEEVLLRGRSYRTYVRQGEGELAVTEFPERGLGRVVPLLLADPSGRPANPLRR